MHKLLNSFAPLGVMTVCTIWCCWSEIREATPLLAATEAKLPRIDRKLLHPELSLIGERDPFLQHKPAPPPASEAVNTQMNIVAEPSFDPQTVLPSIRLDATILGAKSLAVINGKIHHEGEIIVLDAAPKVRCRLLRVHSDGVVMTIEEHEFLIGYSNAAREVTDPAPAMDVVSPTRHGSEGELPEGTPTPDELGNAVASSLAKQTQSTEDQHDLDSGLHSHAADEDCAFEQNLPITDNFDELLNNE